MSNIFFLIKIYNLFHCVDTFTWPIMDINNIFTLHFKKIGHQIEDKHEFKSIHYHLCFTTRINMARARDQEHSTNAIVWTYL